LNPDQTLTGIQIFEESWQERQWKYLPVVGQYGYIGSAAIWAPAYAGGDLYFDPATTDLSDVVTFPLVDVPRQVGLSCWWMGRMANGSTIVPGKYK
jgi:hypothetical protein